MNLPHELLPGYLHLGAWVVYLAVIGAAVYFAPWRQLRDRDAQHVFLGSCVLLLLIWSIKAGIKPGLNFHLLGGTLFTLMFGWELAMVGISLVLVGIDLNSGFDWIGFPLNALIMGGIPVLLSYWVLRLAVRFMPHHFFVYIIVNAYFCAGLAMAATVITSSVLLVGFGPYSWAKIAHDYLPFVPFMVFGEGFMTGMLVTGMALMKPHWLATFSDRRYIAGK